MKKKINRYSRSRRNPSTANTVVIAAVVVGVAYLAWWMYGAEQGLAQLS